MSRGNDRPGTSRDSWDAYWKHTNHIGSYSSDSAGQKVIADFWNECFKSAQKTWTNPSVLDIASGNGILIQQILDAFKKGADVTCLDISHVAASNVRRRFPGVQAVVADAANIPFSDGSFDIVISQFGVEYAGTNAILETIRLLSPGGFCALLLHIEGGKIQKACAANLQAVIEMQQCEFIPRLRELFKYGFAAIHGSDRASYESAATRLQTSVTSVEAILQRYGEDIADNAIANFYSDVAKIHQEMPSYDASEVLGWLSAMENQFATFATRMTSMVNAAIDDDSFKQLCTEVQGKGFELIRADTLMSGGKSLPIGWVLMCS